MLAILWILFVSKLVFASKFPLILTDSDISFFIPWKHRRKPCNLRVHRLHDHFYSDKFLEFTQYL